MKDQACIVGIGETAYVRRPGSGMSLLGLQLQAAVRAIEDAGLDGARIDGLMPFPNLGSAEAFAANLGCEDLRYAATVHMGGAAPHLDEDRVWRPTSFTMRPILLFFMTVETHIGAGRTINSVKIAFDELPCRQSGALFS